MKFLQELLMREVKPPSGLAPSSEPSSLSIPSRFDVGWSTDVGKIRDHNEDTALVITAAHDGGKTGPSFWLFVLADGMGGHRDGEIASSLAARVAAYHIARLVYLPSLIDREHDVSEPALTEVLIEAIRAANDAVSTQVPGAGTTLTCALVVGTQAFIGHVGDSRAYVLTEGRLEQITHDHSLVARLIESGQLTPDEAVDHPQKHVLYRSVGQSSPLEVNTYVREIALGAHLLLCSDGLWDMVDEALIIDLITGASSLQGACEDLIAAANQAGGRDNTTAILWRCPLG